MAGSKKGMGKGMKGGMKVTGGGKTPAKGSTSKVKPAGKL
jgi:hypothetical protein